MRTKERKITVKRRPIYFRIPEELYWRLEEEAKKKGFHTKQAYLIHIIQKELGKG